MLIERLLDENNKLEIKVVNDDNAKYTNLKAFKKDFLPLLGEHRVVRVTEHTFSFQVPELYDTTKVLILFQSDLCLYNINMLRIFEYSFPRFENLNEK